ncbi:MAG: glycosyltransferase [Alphaproteobacteria bacterium]|nr:glycosyltransferase [Alphaproteobacteria bacterium]
MLNVFIGFDPREAVAYHVCSNSLIRHSTSPLAISPLALGNLGAYSETHTDGSNQFIYSRFLVPHLMGYQGWALFVDGDMLLRGDVSELFALRDESKAVMCVHHDYKTKQTQKYLGAANQDYPRKNWSSVVLWNCGHPDNKTLTPDFVMRATGAQLHRFTWLDDSKVGEIPKVWNWLPDEFGANKEAKLLHWTLGTPCFHECANVPMAEEWHREKLLTDFCLQQVIDGPFEDEKQRFAATAAE